MSSEAAAVGTTSAPPTVPSTVPSVNTLAYIQRTFTPSASLISRFSAVARRMRPKRVRCRKAPMPSAMAMLARITSTL